MHRRRPDVTPAGAATAAPTGADETVARAFPSASRTRRASTDAASRPAPTRMATGSPSRWTATTRTQRSAAAPPDPVRALAAQGRRPAPTARSGSAAHPPNAIATRARRPARWAAARAACSVRPVKAARGPTRGPAPRRARVHQAPPRWRAAGAAAPTAASAAPIARGASGPARARASASWARSSAIRGAAVPAEAPRSAAAPASPGACGAPTARTGPALAVAAANARWARRTGRPRLAGDVGAALGRAPAAETAPGAHGALGGRARAKGPARRAPRVDAPMATAAAWRRALRAARGDRPALPRRRGGAFASGLGRAVRRGTTTAAALLEEAARGGSSVSLRAPGARRARPTRVETRQPFFWLTSRLSACPTTCASSSMRSLPAAPCCTSSAQRTATVRPATQTGWISMLPPRLPVAAR